VSVKVVARRIVRVKVKVKRRASPTPEHEKSH